jgi:predicted Rossmann fold flavoprotein
LTQAAASAIVPVVNEERVIVAGGGAAGFFAAITCKEASPGTEVLLLERGPHFLSKVRISGGGRCNVTHACFNPAEFAGHYPRGGRELLGPFSRFQARDTVAWFESRGVSLKTESDGRMFPVSNSSDEVVRCLQDAAAKARVRLESGCGVEHARRGPGGRFELNLSGGRTLQCTRVLIATGGCRTAAGGRVPVELGHTLESPVPSLFSFHIETPWVRALAGLSVNRVEASVPGTGHRAGGALIFTHAGMSGPAILALSAWGARDLHDRSYRFPLRVAWLPGVKAEAVEAELDSLRRRHPARLVIRTPIPSIPRRLWENLAAVAGLTPDTRWSGVSNASTRRLAAILESTELQVSGKSLNKGEFVTCGGVRLSEVNFRTMESRLCRGIYFAGEVLDIDGVTGGFNFQAAWTTGWIAGNALAATSA